MHLHKKVGPHTFPLGRPYINPTHMLDLMLPIWKPYVIKGDLQVAVSCESTSRYHTQHTCGCHVITHGLLHTHSSVWSSLHSCRPLERVAQPSSPMLFLERLHKRNHNRVCSSCATFAQSPITNVVPRDLGSFLVHWICMSCTFLPLEITSWDTPYSFQFFSRKLNINSVVDITMQILREWDYPIPQLCITDSISERTFLLYTVIVHSFTHWHFRTTC